MKGVRLEGRVPHFLSFQPSLDINVSEVCSLGISVDEGLL